MMETIVACLCAEWCGTCREWRFAFHGLAASCPGVRFAWIDIEDAAEEMQGIDVADFPTLLIGNVHRVMFLGPVEPRAPGVRTLIDRAREGSLAPVAMPAALALLQRLASMHGID
jgi:thioredoxin 1